MQFFSEHVGPYGHISVLNWKHISRRCPFSPHRKHVALSVEYTGFFDKRRKSTCKITVFDITLFSTGQKKTYQMLQDVATAIRIRYPSTSVETVDEFTLLWTDVMIGMYIRIRVPQADDLKLFQEEVITQTNNGSITGAIYLAPVDQINTIGDFAIHTVAGWPIVYLAFFKDDITRSVGIVTGIIKERHDLCRMLNYSHMDEHRDNLQYEDLASLTKTLVTRTKTNNSVALKAIKTVSTDLQRMIEKMNSDIKRLQVMEKAIVEVVTSAHTLSSSRLLPKADGEDSLTEQQKVKVHDMVKKYAEYYQREGEMPKYDTYLAKLSRFPKRHKEIKLAAESYISATADADD